MVRRLMLSPLPSSVCAQHSSTSGRCHDTRVYVAYARRERMRIADSVLVDEDGADQSTELWHLYRSHSSPSGNPWLTRRGGDSIAPIKIPGGHHDRPARCRLRQFL